MIDFVTASGSPSSEKTATRSGALNIYPGDISVTPEPLIITLSCNILIITPEAIITGKKNTFLARLLPINLSFKTTAISRLNAVIITTRGKTDATDAVRY